MRALAVLLAASVFQPTIPKTWNDPDVAALEVPLANPVVFSRPHIRGRLLSNSRARVL